MVERRKRKALHEISHHTNITYHYHKNISAINFPNQDIDKLGAIEKIKYRDMYRIDTIRDHGPEETEPEARIYEDDFTIVRFDTEEPYRLIAISLDGSIILVGDTNVYQTQITRYPIQLEEFIGLSVTQKYKQNPYSEIQAITLRVDNGEPCYSVLAELLPNNKIRFVIGDEVESIINEKYSEDNIYNGADPQNYQMLYIDVNGKTPLQEGETISLMVDGKGPDPLEFIYKEDILTDDEIKELRLKLLEERDLYGTD